MEATSYALLVYLLRDGVGIDQEKMVLWLNTMRMFDCAWLSTVVCDDSDDDNDVDGDSGLWCRIGCEEREKRVLRGVQALKIVSALP